MHEELFGELTYSRESESWHGWAHLPRFASFSNATQAPRAREKDSAERRQELERALKAIEEKMTGSVGPGMDKVLADLEAEVENAATNAAKQIPTDTPSEHEVSAEVARRQEGYLRLELHAPLEEPPLTEQHDALRFLLEQEDQVLAVVLNTVFESFQAAYSQEYWRNLIRLQPADSIEALRGRFSFENVRISRSERNGLAFLIFDLDSDWQDEHGLIAVFNPSAGAALWGCLDDLDDLTGPDAPQGHESLAGEDAFFEAIRVLDETEARTLLDQGIDLNAPTGWGDTYLGSVVELLEVDAVRLLLKLGADPHAKDASGKTPQDRLNGLYDEFGFDKEESKDTFTGKLLKLLQGRASQPMAEMKDRMDKIRDLLKTAKTPKR